MTITILYFAMLREQRGRDQETLITSAITAGALYDELCQRHGFTLTKAQVGVAVGDELVSWEAPLAPGDTVAFLPPVSGG